MRTGLPCEYDPTFQVVFFKCLHLAGIHILDIVYAVKDKDHKIHKERNNVYEC